MVPALDLSLYEDLIYREDEGKDSIMADAFCDGDRRPVASDLSSDLLYRLLSFRRLPISLLAAGFISDSSVIFLLYDIFRQR